MKKIIFALFICISLVSCKNNNRNGEVLSANDDNILSSITVKTTSYNGHNYVYIKRIIDDSGNWQHDPVCLLHDLDSLMNKQH